MRGTSGNISLTAAVREDIETREYVSRCEELGVSSCGSTVEEALSMLIDALTVYLDTLENEGQRERLFAETRIAVHHEEPEESEIRARVRARDFVPRLDIPVPG